MAFAYFFRKQLINCQAYVVVEVSYLEQQRCSIPNKKQWNINSKYVNNKV